MALGYFLPLLISFQNRSCVSSDLGTRLKRLVVDLESLSLGVWLERVCELV